MNSLIDRLPGSLIDVETNGTIQDQIELYKKFNIIVVSPKKNTFKTVKESSNFIKTWIDISNSGRNNVFFKFVVGGGLPWSWSESEIRDVIRLSGMDSSKVWLMPAGDNVAKLDVSSKNCWKVAARLNCNYSDRLHIRCGGR
jgi:organic radical activating enzyme